ncbi:MAG: hypothetical protein [Caudoviricetes sp.]|nr:MAG: hypothetical protein [Caudoviricetes sp.]
MAFSIDDIMKSLSSYTGLGKSDSGGTQAFAAPSGDWSANGSTFGSDVGAATTSGMAGANTSSSGLGSGFGLNVGTGQLALGGLQSLAGIFNSLQANKLANQQFKFTKDVTNTNLNNSIKSYNTALSDRANSRYFTQNQSQADADAYINANRLTR